MQLHNKERVWPLHAGAFLMATCLCTWFIALPYIIKGLGGSETHVGLAPALQMLGYAICLMVTQNKHHLNCRTTTRYATIVIFMTTVGTGLTLWLVQQNYPISNAWYIWSTIAMGTIAGSSMAFLWPYLMSWVSGDLEGPLLTRRLGVYNRSWSAATIIGPLLGAGLVEHSLILPIIVAILFSASNWFILSLGPQPKSRHNEIEVISDSPPPSSLHSFLWISRLGLLTNWGCMGILRSQFAIYFTDLGYSETLFGILVMITSITNLISFMVLGKWAGWHGKKSGLIITQVMGLITMLLIALGSSLSMFILAMVLQGIAVAFHYSSHQYYGLAGSKTRSKPMAIHELTIAISVVIATSPSGYLVTYGGTLHPYWYGVGLCALALIIQIAMPTRGLKH